MSHFEYSTMFITERRHQLRLSVDKLHRMTKVPRYRIDRLEQGVESLFNLPYRDACEIACALEMTPEMWYDAVYSQKYIKWLRGRSVSYGL